jgi:hypothetical protein
MRVSPSLNEEGFLGEEKRTGVLCLNLSMFGPFGSAICIAMIEDAG